MKDNKVHKEDYNHVAEWVYNPSSNGSAKYKCSNCGRRTGSMQARRYKYCPKCGFKMKDEIKYIKNEL